MGHYPLVLPSAGFSSCADGEWPGRLPGRYHVYPQGPVAVEGDGAAEGQLGGRSHHHSCSAHADGHLVLNFCSPKNTTEFHTIFNKLSWISLNNADTSTLVLNGTIDNSWDR